MVGFLRQATLYMLAEFICLASIETNSQLFNIPSWNFIVCIRKVVNVWRLKITSTQFVETSVTKNSPHGSTITRKIKFQIQFLTYTTLRISSKQLTRNNHRTCLFRSDSWLRTYTCLRAVTKASFLRLPLRIRSDVNEAARNVSKIEPERRNEKLLWFLSRQWARKGGDCRRAHATTEVRTGQPGQSTERVSSAELRNANGQTNPTLEEWLVWS